jgi:hypothetical protein
VNWTERILDFPVRAAAVDDFLRELRAHGKGDLNAVLTTLNEGGLCREAVDYWTGNGWIVLAPNQPTIALAGPGFSAWLGLRAFCGELAEAEPGAGPESSSAIEIEEESQDDEHP